LSFSIRFGEVIHIHVSRGLWGYRKENSRNPKEILKTPRRNYNMFWITREEQQEGLQGPWRKEKMDMRLEKDWSKEGSQGRTLDCKKLCKGMQDNLES